MQKLCLEAFCLEAFIITLAIKNRNDDFELKELRHHDEVSLLKILSVLFWPE